MHEENLKKIKNDLHKIQSIDGYKEIFDIVKIYFDENDFLKLEKTMEDLFKLFCNQIKYDMISILYDKIKNIENHNGK